jgi:glutamine amidotransferase
VCVPREDSDAIAWSEYDGRRFAAGVRRANTWGMQFHPEKSSTKGRRIVSNWVALARELVG